MLEKHVKWIRNEEGGVRANFDGANFNGVNLSRANLYGADFDGANLDGVSLYGANLYGANFDGAKRFDSEVTSSPIMISNIGSDHGTLEAWPTKKGLIIKRGCFTGTKDEFLKAVKNRHSKGHYGKAYCLAVKFIEESFAARKVSLEPVVESPKEEVSK